MHICKFSCKTCRFEPENATNSSKRWREIDEESSATSYLEFYEHDRLWAKLWKKSWAIKLVEKTTFFVNLISYLLFENSIISEIPTNNSLVLPDSICRCRKGTLQWVHLTPLVSVTQLYSKANVNYIQVQWYFEIICLQKKIAPKEMLKWSAGKTEITTEIILKMRLKKPILYIFTVFLLCLVLIYIKNRQNYTGISSSSVTTIPLYTTNS